MCIGRLKLLRTASAGSTRILRSAGTLCVLTAAIITLSVGGTATAQNTRFQRPLSTEGLPQRPLDQLRLLLNQQQRLHPQPIPPAQQIQDSLNLSDEQMKLLREALKRAGMLSPQNPGPLPGEPPTTPEEALSQLQRLRQDLMSRAIDTGEAPLTGNADDGEGESPSDFPPGNADSRRTPQRSTEPAEAEDDALRQLIPDQRSRNGPGQQESPGSPPTTANGRDVPGSRSTGSPADTAISGRRATDRRPSNSRTTAPRTADQATSESPNDDRTASGASTSSVAPDFDIGEELSSRGVRKALRRLVRDVSKKVQDNARQESDSADAEQSTWRRTLVDALDRVRSDVVETVRESRRRQAAPSESAAPSDRSQDADSTSAGQGSAAFRNTPVEEPAATAEDSSPDLISTLTDQLPEQDALVPSASGWQLAMIIAGLGIAALVYLLSERRQAQVRRHQRGRVLQPVRPEQIRTREDVIRAFHWLIQSQSPDAADWWNHLQAGESLAQQSQGRQESLRQMIRLYERARYERSETAFEQSDLEQARSALAGCLS